jgi:hypothetical protein
VSSTDFTASFTGTPACRLTIVMNSSATTAIAPTNRLIIRTGYSIPIAPAVWAHQRRRCDQFLMRIPRSRRLE